MWSNRSVRRNHPPRPVAISTSSPTRSQPAALQLQLPITEILTWGEDFSVRRLTRHDPLINIQGRTISSPPFRTKVHIFPADAPPDDPERDLSHTPCATIPCHIGPPTTLTHTHSTSPLPNHPLTVSYRSCVTLPKPSLAIILPAIPLLHPLHSNPPRPSSRFPHAAETGRTPSVPNRQNDRRPDPSKVGSGRPFRYLC